MLGIVTTGALIDEAKMSPKFNKNIVSSKFSKDVENGGIDIIRGIWKDRREEITTVFGYPNMKAPSFYKIENDKYTNLIIRAHLNMPIALCGIDFKNWGEVSDTLVNIVDWKRKFLKPSETMVNRFTGKIKHFFHEKQAFDLWAMPENQDTTIIDGFTRRNAHCMNHFSGKVSSDFLFSYRQ